MRITENTEDAVSPVIGIMLMLVITVVIAAVVTAFATGVVSNVDTTPTAMIKINDYKMDFRNEDEGYDWMELSVKHMSGDTLDLDEIKLVMVRNGIMSYFDLSKGSDNYEVSENDGYWNVGETIIITSTNQFGLLQQSIQLPTNAHFQLITTDGGIICETDITFAP
ncbi:MAG: type IV pilin [Methanocorpusculum parvum]|nr:type IV pilin [Methanocorpusculum parvum]